MKNSQYSSSETNKKYNFFRKTNWRFSEALEKLERDSRVFGLTLQSFLVLPMQRVTRYPLLVDVSADILSFVGFATCKCA